MNKIKQCDARILWNDKYDHDTQKRFITDFLVVKFKKDEADEGNWPMHLYKTYMKDIGNCNFDGTWEKATPGVLNLIFFGEYDYENQEHRDRIFRELMKIEEYYNEIIEYRKQRMNFDE